MTMTLLRVVLRTPKGAKSTVENPTRAAQGRAQEALKNRVKMCGRSEIVKG